MMKRLGLTTLSLLLCATIAQATIKPWPVGLICMTSVLTPSSRIGTITDYPWQQGNVDGMFIRIQMKDIETSDGVYDWSLLDECLALAVTSGKWIEVAINMGLGVPDWLKSQVEYRTLTAPDSGDMPAPWHPIYKTKSKDFIANVGLHCDGNSRIRAVTFEGPLQVGECYLATQSPDVTWFNDNATSHGWVAIAPLSVGMTAWVSVSKEYLDAFMVAFPTTTIWIRGAHPFPGNDGQNAMNQLFAYGKVYGPRFGLGECTASAASTAIDPGSGNPGHSEYWINLAIQNNYSTGSTFGQFLINSGGACGADRLSVCDGTSDGCGVNYGTLPCLSAAVAMDTTLTNCETIKMRAVEVYSGDLVNSGYQAMFNTHRSALLALAQLNPPASITIKRK